MLILDVNDERGVLTLGIKGKAEVECCPGNWGEGRRKCIYGLFIGIL